MKSLVLSLAILTFVPFQVVGAQETPLAGPGSRIRVTAPECQLRKQTAILISLESEIFSATVDDEDVECPVGALTRLEVSQGERKWWKASLLGLGVGAGVGLVAGVVAAGSSDDEMAVFGGLIIAGFSTGVGFVIGTVIGVIRKGDDWK